MTRWPIARSRLKAHARQMTEAIGTEPPARHGWLRLLPDEQQRAFQEGTVLIDILTGRVRALGEIGLLDLAVAEPMDGQALAKMLAVHAGRAREQADVLQQLSEEFAHLAVIAGTAPTA